MAIAGKPRSSWASMAVSDTFLRLCLVFTIGFTLMPSEGIGYELCASKRLTNAPCPGCGMTRCGSNLVRGNVVRAFQYHPLGVIFIPICAALGVAALLPRRWREGLRARLVPNDSLAVRPCL